MSRSPRSVVRARWALLALCAVVLAPSLFAGWPHPHMGVHPAHQHAMMVHMHTQMQLHAQMQRLNAHLHQQRMMAAHHAVMQQTLARQQHAAMTAHVHRQRMMQRLHPARPLYPSRTTVASRPIKQPPRRPNPFGLPQLRPSRPSMPVVHNPSRLPVPGRSPSSSAPWIVRTPTIPGRAAPMTRMPVARFLGARPASPSSSNAINQALKTLIPPFYSAKSLEAAGLPSGFSNYFQQYQQNLARMPSILTPGRPTPVPPGSTNSLAALLAANGYGRIANLPATGNTARLIYNDPYIQRLSGQDVYNATLDYITNNYGRNGATRLNLPGVGNGFNLGPGINGNLQLLANLNPLYFGGAPAAGGGSGSPFIDSFGPPVGTLPSQRVTYPY